MSIFDLKGRVALITGAASGIGRALAESFAKRGADLVLVDINKEGLSETKESLRRHNVAVSTLVCDVSSAAEISAVPEYVEKEHGRLDVLVNNAGVALGGTFDQISNDDFEWLLGINLLGPVRMTRALMPLLRSAPEARIVNISSIFGIIPVPGQTAYCTSKFGLRGFSNALHYELRGTNVGITTVHPGGIDTQIAKNARVGTGVSEREMEESRAAAEKALRMPPPKAAEIITRAMERRRRRVLVGSDAKVVAFLERLFPVSAFGFVERIFVRP